MLMRRLCLLLGLCCLTWIAGIAQPNVDDTWLVITLLQQDGTPLLTPVQLQITHIEGKTTRQMGRAMTPVNNLITVIDLLPGKAEATLNLLAYGLIDGPRPLELLPGPNAFEWRLPRIIPVIGEIVHAGKPLTGMQVFLKAKNRPAEPRPMPVSPKGTTVQLLGVLPGAYQLLLLAEQGYSLVEFTVGEADGKPMRVPLPVQAGGMLEAQVYDDEDNLLVGAQVTLTREVAPGFTLTLPLTTSANGKITSPPLPAGEWAWTATLPDHQKAHGITRVVAGVCFPLPITLEQR